MKDLEEHVAKMAEACGCLYRGDKRKWPPTKLKWWWLPVIAGWLYVIYRLTLYVLASPLRKVALSA